MLSTTNDDRRLQPSSSLLRRLEEMVVSEGHHMKDLTHLIDEVFINTVVRPSSYPLLSRPSFRPSEVIQGVYVGGFKDVTPELRRSTLRPSRGLTKGGHGIRVYVCCCWAGSGSVVERGVHDDNDTGGDVSDVVSTSNTTTKNIVHGDNPIINAAAKASQQATLPRRALLQTIRIPTSSTSTTTSQSKLQPPSSVVVEQFTVPLVSYSYSHQPNTTTTTTTDDAEDIVQKCIQWLHNSTWYKMNVTTAPKEEEYFIDDSSNGSDGAVYELHIKVPIEDEDTFIIEGPVTTTTTTIPVNDTSSSSNNTTKVGRGFLTVISGILEAVLAISSTSPTTGGIPQSPPSAPLPQPPPRSFGIVIYCAAGKSRSVTILTSLLCRLLIHQLHTTPTTPTNGPTPLGTGRDVDKVNSGGGGAKVASCVLASVLGYIQKRRTAACPNGGFRQALVEFIWNRLSTSQYQAPQPKQE